MTADSQMNPDKFQQAWQAQSSQTRVMIDADLLLKEVQRNEREFRYTIFWRDFREVAVALLMLPVWFYLGHIWSAPWTWYLTVPVLVWMAGFMLVYRMRHKQMPSKPNEPLLESVERSLAEVDAQIWLLRNIFWWYLLPPAVSILAHLAHVTWLKSDGWLDSLTDVNVLVGLFLVALYYFLYYWNQSAVRWVLEPRRQELLTLLASLGDESTLEHAKMRQARSVESSRKLKRWMIAAVSCIVTLTVIAMASGIFDSAPDESHTYPKRSPFSAVRWNDSQPEVEIGGEWFKLLSLDNLSTTEIVAFSQQTYGNQWRKRFEEDFVELLTRMGHPPQDTVKLVVQSLTSSETHVLEDVPLTEANRQAIKAAALRRENSER